MKTKQYKLLKDLPGLKAGAIFKYVINWDVWINSLNKGYSFTKDEIKDTSWFEIEKTKYEHK